MAHLQAERDTLAAHAQAASEAAAERRVQLAALEASLHEEQDKAAASAAERNRTLAKANAEIQAAEATAAEKARELPELKGKLEGAEHCLTLICLSAIQ